MVPQKNNYLAHQLNARTDRYSSGKRLGDRTLFASVVDGKRYYSSLDAEIFIGNTYIDDLVQINWSVEQATMPLFGYNSYTFDDLAVGARQVAGTFVVNFTKAGFMYDVLRNTQAISRSTFRSTLKANESGKLNWSSNFDREHSAAWDRSFNIQVGYGDHTKGGKHTTAIVIYCVQLTGCQQILSANGEVIGETYSFIAKDVRYEMTPIPQNTIQEEKPVEEKEPEEAVFAIEYAYINYDTTLDSFTLRTKINLFGGTFVGAKARIKEDNLNVITNVPFELGKTPESITVIPQTYHRAIKECLDKQRRMGVKDDNLILHVDFTVNYSVDGSEKYPLSKNNVRVKVVIGNAQ